MSETTQIIIRAKDESSAAINAVKGSLNSLSQTAIGLGPVFGSLTALLSFGAFKSAIDGTIKFAAALDDMAESTGASVENLSALAGVAKVGGHELGSVEAGLQKLAKALHSTDEETKGAGKALAALGLNINDLAAKDTAEAMLDVAKAMDQFKDGSAKTAVAIAILGKNGAALLPFLKDLAEKSELVGKVTAEQAAMAENYEKNMNRLSAQMSSTSKAIALELLPSLSDTAESMLKAYQEGDRFYALLRGLAGIGKIPIDIVFGSSAPDVSVSAHVKELENQLKTLTNNRAEVDKNGGLLNKWLYGSTAELDKKIEITTNQLETLRKHAKELEFKKPAGADKPEPNFKAAPDKVEKPARAGRAEADDAARLIKQLDEQIAVQQAAAAGTDKMTAAEQQAVKVRYQLEAGTLKATTAQRAKINADLDALVALEETVKKQQEWSAALDKQEQSNVKGNQAMLEQIAAAERAAELYGLNAAQISVVEQARLADAIAIARENGASEEQIKFLEDELKLRGQLSEALIKGETKKQEQKDAEAAIDKLNEMDEFAKKAAQSMQSSFADFLFDPFKDGTKSMLQSFGDTVRRMIAEAASAQLLKSLFGDMGKTGKLGSDSLVGKGLDWLAGMFEFANGGIMTSAGPLPLHKYAMGGIANSPQLAMFGEGRTPEAYVPLPDGRNIPVKIAGNGGGAMNVVVNVNSTSGDPAEIRRSAAAGARTALGIMGGARRYG